MIGMEIEGKKGLELSPSLEIGGRLIFVVSESLLINTSKGYLIFGMMVSPVFVVIIEHDQSYAYSLLEGTEVDLEELYLKNPSLKEKLNRKQRENLNFKTKDTSQAGAALEFSNNDESSEF